MFAELYTSAKITLHNKRLLGFGFLEAAALAAFTVLFYLLFLAILQLQLGIPTNVVLSYFSSGALPPDAQQIVNVGSLVYGLLVLVLLAYFESGIFSLVTGKSFVQGTRVTGVFVLLAVGFEIVQLLLALLGSFFGAAFGLLYEPIGRYLALFLVFLAGLFVFVWQTNARFEALKQGPIKSFTESLFFVWAKKGLWGKAVLTLILVALGVSSIVLLLLALALMISEVFAVLFAIFFGLFMLAVIVYANLVLKVFFLRIREKAHSKRPASRSRVK